MSEKIPSNEPPIVIKRRTESEATGWENEQAFTAEEIIDVIKQIEASAGNLRVTDMILAFDDTLLSASLREKGSSIGYCFMMKGKYGTSSTRTVIERLYYMGPDTNELDGNPVEIAEYKNSAWK